MGENGLIDQIRELDESRNDVSRILSEVDEELFLLEEKLAITETNIDHIDEIAEEANKNLDELQDTLEFDGQRAFEEATKRAKIAGEQSDRMTKLAHEARDLTNDIESRAKKIVTIAADAKNKSIEAYTEVKEANFQQAQLVEDIKNFKDDIALTEKKLNDTISWTKEVSSKSSLVKSNVTTLLSELNNIMIPKINIQALSEKSHNLREEALKIREETEELLKNTSDLRKTLNKQNEDREKLLVKAKNQQEDIIDLKNDLVFALEQANAASKLWDEIYEGAVSNYKLLTGNYIF